MKLSSLLAVFGHPDDESLAAGGILAQHSAAGARIAVVTAMWSPTTQRAAELADALRIHPRSSVKAIEEVIGARRAVYTTPDEKVMDRVDVSPWLEQKVAAILAHRSEVDRGALPGLVARLSPVAREQLLSTEWFIRRPMSS